MSYYLFSNQYKAISGWIFYVTTIIGTIIYFSEPNWDDYLVIKVPALIYEAIIGEEIKGIWVENGVLDELLSIILIISGIIHSFSKEKMEDEYISSIRLKALIWAIYINYGMVLLATLTIYGISYMHIMIIHLFSLIILFNIRFQLSLRNYYKTNSDEE